MLPSFKKKASFPKDLSCAAQCGAFLLFLLTYVLCLIILFYVRLQQGRKINMKKTMRFAFTPGDGSAPEQMEQVLRVLCAAGQKFGVEIDPVLAPMGWCVFKDFGDTLPGESLKIVQDIGIHLFGGVGEKLLDKTLGAQYPKMKPEGRALLTIRDVMGLLVNERPAIYLPELRKISRVAGIANGEIPIPPNGIRQIWLRYLLEGEYFGNRYFRNKLGSMTERSMGLKLKDEVTGDEPIISNISYFTREKVQTFLRYAFTKARELRSPLLCVAKANVLPDHVYFWLNAKKMRETEFADVELREVIYSDDCTQLLFEPGKLAGIILCTNKDGDMLSDGALKAIGSMGLMCSSAINPETGAAMFESGAGTYPEAKGKDIANPIGRIITGAMMVRHAGFSEMADCIENATRQALQRGYRTQDIFTYDVDCESKNVGTVEMTDIIISLLYI